MKTLKLTTKSKADSLLIDSLFTTGGTLNKTRYDMGKYKPENFPIGREIEVQDHIHAVWKESRKDSYGPYVILHCLYK